MPPNPDPTPPTTSGGPATPGDPAGAGKPSAVTGAATGGRPDRARRILSGEARDPLAMILRAATAAAEPFYTAAARGRNAAFDRGWRSIHRAGLPVISVGNLTAGGTGKTPMVITLARMLQQLGHPPAVLMRGYRGEGPTGSDEQALLAHRLPGVPIHADADRVAGARTLHQQHPALGAILLDDGFQHRRLHRDLDLVLIDATDPFGLGHVLPRGLLREPPAALRRADAVLITHADHLDEDAARELADRIEQYHGKPPLAWFEHRWGELLDESDRPVQPGEGTAVLPFCGIGNPAAFFRQAGEVFRVVEPQSFTDHHPYTAAELGEIARRAGDAGADALLTTEKDWARIGPLLESADSRLPIWRPVLDLHPARGQEALQQLVRQTLQSLEST